MGSIWFKYVCLSLAMKTTDGFYSKGDIFFQGLTFRQGLPTPCHLICSKAKYLSVNSELPIEMRSITPYDVIRYVVCQTENRHHKSFTWFTKIIDISWQIFSTCNCESFHRCSKAMRRKPNSLTSWASM